MSSKPGSPYNTARWRALKREFLAMAPPYCRWERCPVPGRAVNMLLSGSHPWGPTVDHIVPTSMGGAMWDPRNLQLLHRRCNSSKGDRMTPRRPEQDRIWSRRWL